MRFISTTFTAVMAAAFFTWHLTAQASNESTPENNNANFEWMPQQTNNDFWQAPDWRNFSPPSTTPAQDPQKTIFAEPATKQPASPKSSASQVMPYQAMPYQSMPPQPMATQNQMQQQNMPPPGVPQQIPGYNYNYQPPMPQGPASIQPYRVNPYLDRRMYQPMYPQSYNQPNKQPINPMNNMYQPYSPANMYQGYSPTGNRPFATPYMPNYGGSGYNMPGFNQPGYNRFNNNNGGNNFWGNSGPSTWSNPDKQNMERGWDDMINAPSRMGTMPGGWNAPEVTMPNPIDMGDQFQENAEDLPEQLRNMDVGN